MGLPKALCLAELGQIPRELYEPADLDHASRGTVLRRIMLPLSVPALTTLFKEKTGKHCLAAETQSSEGKMVRLWESVDAILRCYR